MDLRQLDRLHVKLFLAIAGVIAGLTLVTYLVFTWSFERGFVQYVNRADEARLAFRAGSFRRWGCPNGSRNRKTSTWLSLRSWRVTSTRASGCARRCAPSCGSPPSATAKAIAARSRPLTGACG